MFYIKDFRVSYYVLWKVIEAQNVVDFVAEVHFVK